MIKVTDQKTPTVESDSILVQQQYGSIPTPPNQLSSGVYYSWQGKWLDMWDKFVTRAEALIKLNLAAYVPKTRTITINGDTKNLSEDRSWTISGGTQNLEEVLTEGNDGGGLQIKNIADPIDAQDAVTKNYIDTNYVPYTGATNNVDLDTYSLNAKSLNIKGTGGNGHLGLKWQSADATAGGNETALWADSDGDLKWKIDGHYITNLISSGNTANRNYTLPNATGTLALTSDIPSVTPAALTKTDDTNVTLTLGGTPSTSLLQAVSLTLGWTGTLADSRIASASTWNAKIGGSGTTNELAYFSGSSTIGSLTTSTYPSLTELSYVKGVTSAIQTQLNTALKKTVLYCRNDTTIATTANTEIVMDVYAIPANTLLTYDTLIILAGARMVRTAGTWTINIGISTSSQTVGNAPTSGTTIGFFSSTATRNGYLQHIYKITGSTTLDYVGAGNTDANYIGLNPTTSGNSTTIDRTGIIYVYASMTMGTSGDTGTLKDFVIERIKGG